MEQFGGDGVDHRRDEPRLRHRRQPSWWKRRLIAIALTVGLALFILTSFGLIVAGPWLADFLGRQFGLAPAFTWTWKILQWPVVFLLASTGFGFVYYFAPDADQEWVWITPGALTATVLWLLASLAFRFYVVNFGNYEEAYGTLGAIILTLLWFYITGLAMVIGAELSAEIHRASPWGTRPRTEDHGTAETAGSCRIAGVVQTPPARIRVRSVTKSRTPQQVRFMHLEGMEYITFDFLLGFLLAVALMVALWVPLFFFDYKAEKKRGTEPIGSGENPPTPPLDKVH